MSRFPRRPSVRAALSLLLAAVAAAALTTPAPTAAQQTAPAPPPEVFLDVVEVDVVNLEVIVRGRDGEAVRGLGRDDFVVLEDGQPVELSNFYAVESARKVLPPEATAAEAPVLVELPRDQALNLAVVIDNDNISPANRKRALDQVRQELDLVLRPGDRVMVGVLEGVPRVEQTFTENLDAVDAALDRIERSTSGNPTLAAQRKHVDDLLSRAQSDFGQPSQETAGGFSPDILAQPIDYANEARSYIETYAHQADHQMRLSFAALNALVSSLSGLPSRKAVLLVSEGLSTNPALELYEAMVDVFGPVAADAGVHSPAVAARSYDLTELLDDVARNAAASRVTFYTLDAFGGRGMVSAEASGVRPLQVSVDQQQQETLVQLAAATGGSAMLNAGNVDELVARMADDYSDYYSLGFVSRHGRDGDFHRLEVRVPGREDVQVRHTEGYRAKPVAEEMADRALAALVLDVARNPLEVRIELGRETREDRGRFVVPVLVKVPVSKLALIPQRDVHQGRVSIWIAVRDEAGGLSEPKRLEIPLEIPNEQLLSALSRDVGHGVNLLVRGGRSKLAVAVRDEVAAVESTVNLNIAVGDG